MSPAKVFISYSRKDEVWRDRLLEHLAPLVRGGRIAAWDVGRIPPGAELQASLEEATSGTEIGVFLISPAFLASDVILRNELQPFLERRAAGGLRLVPVLVRACAVELVDWLSPLHRLPESGEAIARDNEAAEDELLADVARAIAKLLPDEEARALAVSSTARFREVDVDLARLPLTSGALFGREAELSVLDAAWEDSTTRVLSIVAWGGVGKTALVSHWLARLARGGYRGAERVLGWSFYNQGAAGSGTSADLFTDTMLRKLGDADPNKGSAWDKGDRLARLFRWRKTLLVLDGLEPLQEPSGADEGRLRDPAMQTFLRGLCASIGDGLCVVTTRVAVADLEPWRTATAPVLDLDRMSEESGVRLLREAKVEGDDDELRQAVRDYDGHGLGLVLLGTYLARLARGDIRARREIRALSRAPQKGDQAARVMQSYDGGLSPIERAYLRIVGLFDRPADGASVRALLVQPPIDGLTDALTGTTAVEREEALSHLRLARLLREASRDDPDALDAHPLVREHFGEALLREAQEAVRIAHGRLFDHLRTAAKELPGNIQEMGLLYAAVVHGCRAGRGEEALDVYMRRIQRGNEYFNSKKLGAFGAELTALAGFFDPLWERLLPSLSERAKAYVLNEAGYALRAVGRPAVAVRLMEMGIEESRSAGDLVNAAITAGNLSELLLALGEVRQAIERARESVALADRSGDPFRRTSTRTTLADALHQVGSLLEAERMFTEAEQMQHERQPERRYLYSVRGYRFCELLLSLGREEEVLLRATEMLAPTNAKGDLLSIGLTHVSLGRAALSMGRLGSAGPALADGVAALRRAGELHILPLGLLARAEYHRVSKDLPACEANVKEAHTLAVRAGLLLVEADACLALTRLGIARGATTAAAEHLARARHLVTRCAYGRRDGELASLQAALAARAS